MWAGATTAGAGGTEMTGGSFISIGLLDTTVSTVGDDVAAVVVVADFSC